MLAHKQNVLNINAPPYAVSKYFMSNTSFCQVSSFVCVSPFVFNRTTSNHWNYKENMYYDAFCNVSYIYFDFV